MDYEDSLVPGQIVASILRLPDVTDREEAELAMALVGDTDQRSVSGTASAAPAA